MAIIGEVACLSAAIIALPAFLLWRRVRPLDEPPPAPASTASERGEPPTTSL